MDLTERAAWEKVVGGVIVLIDQQREGGMALECSHSRRKGLGSGEEDIWFLWHLH